MSARCDECSNARIVHSENGSHAACTLSNKRQERCLMDERFFKRIISLKQDQEEEEGGSNA